MPFQPGISGNAHGRPVGSKNKRSEAIYEAYSSIFEENIEKLKIELQKLEGKDFCTVMLTMAEYVLPKRSRVSLDAAKEDAPVEYFQLGDVMIPFN